MGLGGVAGTRRERRERRGGAAAQGRGGKRGERQGGVAAQGRGGEEGKRRGRGQNGRFRIQEEGNSSVRMQNSGLRARGSRMRLLPSLVAWPELVKYTFGLWRQLSSFTHTFYQEVNDTFPSLSRFLNFRLTTTRLPPDASLTTTCLSPYSRLKSARLSPATRWPTSCYKSIIYYFCLHGIRCKQFVQNIDYLIVSDHQRQTSNQFLEGAVMAATADGATLATFRSEATEGIAAQLRKGNRPLLPWGCRGMIVWQAARLAGGW